MMSGIVGSSLRLRYLVAALAVALLVIGLLRLRDAPVDALPEFAPPFVEIQTEALGLSAAEVEALVTVPLEELLQGVAWLDRMTSQSVPGLSSIVLWFEPGTDLLRARQMVQERLTQAQGMPSRRVAKAPVMLQPLSSASRVLMVGLTSDELSLIELSVLARWTIKPRLMGVPGVANVAVWGQRERQLQVQVDPERLRAEGLTLQQVIRTTGEALWVSPLTYLNASTPGSGGWIDAPNQRLGIRHLLPISSPEDLARVSVVDREGLLLGDVTTLAEDHQPLIGDAIVGDGPGLLLVVEKFPGQNTLAVTRDVERALDALRPGLGGVVIDTEAYRPATFLETALARLRTLLLVGLGLAALALLLVLGDARAALVGLAAIALAFVAAALVLELRGATFNALVLAGLLVALGAVVDDAVADVEAMLRRLRTARREGSTTSAAALLWETSLELRSSLAFATLILLLAALPLLFLGGVPGALLRPLALSYGLALLAAMAVALTVTPALALLLLRDAGTAEPGADGATPAVRASPLLRGLHRAYDRVAPELVGRSAPALLTVGALVLVGLVVLPGLRLGEPLPAFQERHLLLRLDGPAGASHAAMSRLSGQAARELRALPGVRGVTAHIGRAVTSDRVVGIHQGELWVRLEPDADYASTLASVRATLEGYPGGSRAVATYLGEVLGEARTDAGAGVVVRVYGHDLDVLRTTAEEIDAALAEIDGVRASRVQVQTEEPVVEIEVDLAAAEAHGLKPGDVRRAAATLVNGIEVGNLFEDQKVFDVIVMGTPATRHSLSSLHGLLIDTPAGGHARLGDVASVRLASAPTILRREGASRRLDVVADVAGRDVAAVVRDVEARLAGIAVPFEVHAEVLGDWAARRAVRRGTLAAVIAAALGIFLLLQAAFASWRLAAATFLILPTALVGGLFVAYAGGGELGLGHLVGLLAVLGVAVRHAVVLLRRLLELETREGQPLGAELIRRGVRERLAPVLATTLATGLALLPIALGGEGAGLELLRPLALVTLGGLATSVLVTLLVVPALYLRYRDVPDLDLAPAPGRPLGGTVDAAD